VGDDVGTGEEENGHGERMGSLFHGTGESTRRGNGAEGEAVNPGMIRKKMNA